MKEPQHASDILGLVPDCECYCCRNHSKAYLNHLFKHNEMTGGVLLTIHNCHVTEELKKILQSEEYQKNKKAYIKAFNFLFN